jgi:hypothetical protein
MIDRPLPPHGNATPRDANPPATGSGRRFATLMENAAQLPSPQVSASSVAGDILYGADAIALFLFGERKYRRRVYNLVEGNGLPIFRVGVNVCARKSVLLQWIAVQERSSSRHDISGAS